MTWFEIDRNGLRAQLQRRGVAFAVFELIQNAWDSGSDRVDVRLEPLPGSPYARLEVEDFSEAGFADLADAYTMFAPSTSAPDPEKRGRFNTGEKLVLALCRSAAIETTSGSVSFSEAQGRRTSRTARPAGTLFRGEIRITRDQIFEVSEEVSRLIPPVPTTYNGETLGMPMPLHSFEVKLPTEFAAIVSPGERSLRRTVRKTRVELYEGAGEVLELGIPVVEADIGFRADVLQKVPLNSDRDNVPPAFLRTLRVAIVNEMHERIDRESTAEPWVQEAAGDSRISGDAFRGIVRKRFGDRALVAVPGDPRANATAEAAGYSVIHGGSMSGDAWGNARKFEAIPSTSSVFPSPSSEVAEACAKAAAGSCPVCGQPMGGAS